MLRIGSRGSQLALWQTRWVAARLQQLGHPTEIEIIKTTGDKITDVALSKVGAKGLFTKELEEALLARTVDLAVHSLKDMPTDLPEGLALTAIPEREDARDAVVGKTLAQLPNGARVGTSSLRRSAQLRLFRPDLVIESVRGNIDTRLRKLDEGQFDSIVLAAAGLRRLGLASRIAELLDHDIMCPAVGQGALALETRDGDDPAAVAVRRLDHPRTAAAVRAERAVLRGLGGGCQVPIGAYAIIQGERLHLMAVVIAPDASQMIRRRSHGAVSDAESIGAELARELREEGAARILETVYGAQ
ncbi:MAG: hydroxymethylbilane synthase [Bryobacteraceae bacterium]